MRRFVAALCASCALPFAAAAAPARVAPECAPFRSDRAAVAPLRTGKLKVGVALGSGSMHGLAHIGVIQELEARGVKVDVVSGTSVGALVGSLWASGMSGSAIQRLSRTSKFEDFAAFAGSFQGLFDNNAIRAPLETAFAGRPIEAWPRRFGAVATNMANGERRILARGDGVTAVQASSAVPVMFRPIVVDGERLADGALVEPVPVDAARALGADFVIGVDVAYRPFEEPASGIPQYAFQAMHILVNSLAAQQLRTADVALRLNVHHRFMACGHDGLVAAGREAVRNAWPEILAAVVRKQANADRRR